jgi:hypothetical protein
MNLEKEFSLILKNDSLYQQAEKVVQQNSHGQIWLIGGFIFRNLAHLMYSLPKSEKIDFDFLADQVKSDLSVPSGWEIKQNRYYNPRFICQNQQIDLTQLSLVRPILQRGLDPTIENYLACVPLTIQSIAYDLQTGKLLGEIGQKALKEKTVAVNDLKQCLWYCQCLGKTLEEYLTEKAASLGFKMYFG